MRAYGMPRRLCSQTASKGCLGSGGYTENNLHPRQPKFAAFKAENFACRRGFTLGNIHLRPESKLPPRSPLARELFREGREAGNGTISGLSCLAHRTPFEMVVPPVGQILVDLRELFRGEGEAEMSTFSRSLPAWMRSSRGPMLQTQAKQT